MELTNLSLALVINILGSAFILAVIATAGWRKLVVIESKEVAASRFEDIRPELKTLEVVVACNGKTSLLSLSDGQNFYYGIVAASGSKLSPRLISPSDTQVELVKGGLFFRFSTVTWTPLLVELEQSAAKYWLRKFECMNDENQEG